MLLLQYYQVGYLLLIFILMILNYDFFIFAILFIFGMELLSILLTYLMLLFFAILLNFHSLFIF